MIEIETMLGIEAGGIKTLHPMTAGFEKDDQGWLRLVRAAIRIGAAETDWNLIAGNLVTAADRMEIERTGSLCVTVANRTASWPARLEERGGFRTVVIETEAGSADLSKTELRDLVDDGQIAALERLAEAIGLEKRNAAGFRR